MAIEYTFEVDGAFLQPELEGALQGAGFARLEQDHKVWQATGATASVGGTVDIFHVVERAVGFDPGTKIFFSIDKFDAYEAGMAAMLRTVTQALTAVPDDAVLIGNHDTALLVRRDGRITLTDRDGWWTDATDPRPVSYIPEPHRFETLPIL